MRPRLDVARELAHAGRLSGVVSWLCELEQHGVLEELDRQLKLEGGALARGSKSLPAIVKRAAEFGFRLYVALHGAVGLAGFVAAMRREGVAEVKVAEERLVAQLQVLMDLAFESQDQLGSEERQAVAGLGGSAMPHFEANSGIEAAAQIAFDAYSVIRGLPSWLLTRLERAGEQLPRVSERVPPQRSTAARLQEEAPRRRRSVKANARSKGLGFKDRAMLVGIAEAPDSVKSIAKAASKFLGSELTEQAVRHRKKRLERLGLVEPEGGIYRLTAKGKQLVETLKLNRAGDSTGSSIA